MFVLAFFLEFHLVAMRVSILCLHAHVVAAATRVAYSAYACYNIRFDETVFKMTIQKSDTITFSTFGDFN